MAGSAIANDFAGFLARHGTIRTVFFNGTTARSLWERRVRPTLPMALEMPLVTLPSTSPANTRLAAESKLAAWRAVRDAVADG